jgi:hypothetical protein
MMFATFNVQKIKTVQELNNRYRHNSRKCLKSNKDIDKSKIHLNISNDADAYSEIKNRIKEINETRKSKGARSLRSDTVVAVEVLLGASGEFWEDASEEEKLEWLDTNLTWLNEHYKGAGKVVRWDYHLDETDKGNPHIHAIIIPETTDPKGLPTLSAKKMVGSSRDLEQARTSHAEANKVFGLERGVKWSDMASERTPNLPLKELKQQTIDKLKDNNFLDDEIQDKLKDLKELESLTGSGKKDRPKNIKNSKNVII